MGPTKKVYTSRFLKKCFFFQKSFFVVFQGFKQPKKIEKNQKSIKNKKKIKFLGYNHDTIYPYKGARSDSVPGAAQAPHPERCRLDEPHSILGFSAAAGDPCNRQSFGVASLLVRDFDDDLLLAPKDRQVGRGGYTV